MYVTVNGARLFFDVDGAQWEADGPRLTEKPVLLLLHGGPGADHAVYKPAFSALSDVAQVIYLDHRGNGRSEPCGPESWTLDHWARDVHGFCEALGISRPIVLGTSFGGFVAQAYATMFPQHPSKLILISTAAKFDFDAMLAAFERLGGSPAREAAENYWLSPTSEARMRYREVCLPLYARQGDPDWIKRVIFKDDVALHFNGIENEQSRMDFRAALSLVTCPVLLMVGEDDPVTPPVCSEAIAAALTQSTLRFERYGDCGHGVVGDQPERSFAALRSFIASA